MKLFGYTKGNQRVVAVRGESRVVLAWGENITEPELYPFVARWPGFDIVVEPVDDPEEERRRHPPYAGRA